MSKSYSVKAWLLGLFLISAAAFAQSTGRPVTPWAANPNDSAPDSNASVAPTDPNANQGQMAPMPEEQPQDSSGGGGSNPLQNIMNALGGGGAGSPGTQSGRDESVNSGDDYSSPYAPSASPVTAGTASYASRIRGGAPIKGPFQEFWPKCTNKLGLGECSFIPYGIFPSAAHCAKSPRSCHNTGHAIDVGFPLTCAGGKKIGKNDPMAMEVAKCMANPGMVGSPLKVIFKDQVNAPNMIRGNPRGAHHGHMHIQFANCPGGRC